MKIIIRVKQKEFDIEYQEARMLLGILIDNHLDIPALCGGNGTCKKCKVLIEDSNSKRVVLACKTIIKEDTTIILDDYDGKGLIFSKLNDKYKKDYTQGFGVALDIGTTTLAYYLVDLSNGNIIDSTSKLNPQMVFGADVISRIKACIEGKLSELNEAIISSVNSTLEYFKGKHSIVDIEKLVVSGNTTMLHLFNNTDVSSLGKVPFTPVFLDLKELRGIDLKVDAKKVILMPSFSSFVGADIVCGAISTNVLSENSMLIDIGTNGEILLNYDNKIYTSSTSAGPAFEGSEIECGMGGVSGAISEIKLINNELHYKTIDNAPIKGICGSGLFDAVSIMLDKGIINSFGAFEIDSNKYYISDSVYISQKDIRKFQLAKSAIRSGIDTLIKTSNIDINKIDKIYIAGGLGYYISSDSLIRVGLIPKELKDKIEVVGNTSLAGSYLALMSNECILDAVKISKRAIDIDLSTSKIFLDKFTDNMLFDEE